MQLHVHRLGEAGRPVLVLVHGSLLDGIRTWAAQRPLAARFELLIPDRRGYGRTPLPPGVPPGEDFAVDAADLVELLEDLPAGGHLAGHSYGGLVALLAAITRPQLVRSLTLVEPPAFAVARGAPAVEALIEHLTALMAQAPSLRPEAFLAGFLAAVGVPPAAEGPLSPPLQRGLAMLAGSRPPWDAPLPLGALAAAGVPCLAVTGAHEPAFEVVADRIAAALRGERLVVAGWGHAIPYAGPALDEPLARFVEAAEGRWRDAARTAGGAGEADRPPPDPAAVMGPR